MEKVKIPVYLLTSAYKYIGDVEISHPDQFNGAAMKLWDETGEDISVNISNDFEVGDSDIDDSVIKDWEDYKQRKEED